MSSVVGRQAAVRRLPRAARVKGILDCATKVFEEKGFDASSTAEIAELVGVVEGTIYRYFNTKLDLFIKVVEEWYTQMLSDYDKQLRGISGTSNRLRFMIWWQLHVVYNAPAMSRLIYQDLRYRPEYRSTEVFKLQREYTRRTVGIIAEAVKAGEFRPNVKLSVVRDMIHGGVEHATFPYMRGEGRLNPDEVADTITEIIYGGLAKNAPLSKSGLDDPLARLERIADRFEEIQRKSECD